MDQNCIGLPLTSPRCWSWLPRSDQVHRGVAALHFGASHPEAVQAGRLHPQSVFAWPGNAVPMALMAFGVVTERRRRLWRRRHPRLDPPGKAGYDQDSKHDRDRRKAGKLGRLPALQPIGALHHRAVSSNLRYRILRTATLSGGSSNVRRRTLLA